MCVCVLHGLHQQQGSPSWSWSWSWSMWPSSSCNQPSSGRAGLNTSTMQRRSSTLARATGWCTTQGQQRFASRTAAQHSKAHRVIVVVIPHVIALRQLRRGGRIWLVVFRGVAGRGAKGSSSAGQQSPRLSSSQPLLCVQGPRALICDTSSELCKKRQPASTASASPSSRAPRF